jgi:DNA-binding NtrC family response regulator
MAKEERIDSISLDERLRALEGALIIWALNMSQGNKSRAAKLLRIKRSTLGDRIRHCGLGRLVPVSIHKAGDTAMAAR